LQKQLKQKGYKIELKDFRQNVNEYYAKARNRHRYYGIKFPVYTTQSNEIIHFKIEIENEYYYGFPRPEKKENPELIKVIQQVSGTFKANNWWYGWKYPDRNNLDFWNLHSEGFNRLKYPRKQEQLIIEIAEDIDMCINKFIKTAQQNNL
jgi:hypothetical protein